MGRRLTRWAERSVEDAPQKFKEEERVSGGGYGRGIERQREQGWRK